jgi:hypothetical protein
MTRKQAEPTADAAIGAMELRRADNIGVAIAMVFWIAIFGAFVVAIYWR